MSDRTLDNRTFKSKKLAALSILAFGLFPYIFQQTDDWGCIVADPELIKAQRFPKIKWIDEEMIELCIKEYNEVGMLFLWDQDGYRYGFFVRFEAKSGRYLSKRRKRETPEPPADLLAKFLKDNNHFQSLPTVPNCSYKLSQVKLSQVNKDKNIPAPSAVELSTFPQQDKKSVRDFIAKDTSFGTGRTDTDFRDEVKAVCLSLARRCSDWGEPVEDEDRFVDKFFGLVSNLMRFGLAKKPERIKDFKGNPTSKTKMKKLISRMSKPRNLVAELIDAVKKQPKYLP